MDLLSLEDAEHATSFGMVALSKRMTARLRRSIFVKWREGQENYEAILSIGVADDEFMNGALAGYDDSESVGGPAVTSVSLTCHVLDRLSVSAVLSVPYPISLSKAKDLFPSAA